MLIVTGHFTVAVDALEKALVTSIAHVRRSRTVAGCLAHGVHLDAEQPGRLVFVEHWADAASLVAHLRSPETRAFGRSIGLLAAAPPVLEVFEAESIPLPH